MKTPKKLPKRKPRYANPNHPMNAERTTGDPRGVNRKAGGGKLKMVEKNGKKVPFYAADGVGKMAKGGGVKVKSGDTLSQIAKKNNISLRDLLAANPSIKNANQIKVGQSIKLPNTKMAGSSIGATRNPYKGMSKSDMADMDVKNKSKKRQQAVTARSRVSAMDELKAKAKKKQAPKRTMRGMSSSGMRDDDVAAYKGGAMKKAKGYKHGGSMCRGGGAATKGKRYGKSG
ncbi:MAG: LysM domain-containing protein [Burkholderiaceae bacterium]